MKNALYCIEDGSTVKFPTEYEAWLHVRANGLCSEEIDNEDLPRRRILNPKYEIHTYDPDGTLIAMSRARWS
jgi:NADH:ubiquinone oxidoreductase subunit